MPNTRKQAVSGGVENASVRRRVLDNTEEDVGDPDERVQCRENQAGNNEPLYAAAACALELRLALLTPDLRRDERESDFSQFTIPEGCAGG
jgi:hypothetical protein